MKIGYICVQISRQQYGASGAATHIQEICRSIEELGHEVFYVGGGLAERYQGLRRYDIQPRSLMGFARFRYELRKIADLIWAKLGQENPSSSHRIGQSVCPQIQKTSHGMISWSPLAFWNDIRTRIDTLQFDCHFYREACKVIEKEQPDALYERFNSYCFSGTNLAQRYGLPLILEMNGSSTFRREWETKHSPLYGPIVRETEKRICQSADAIAVVTPFVKRYLLGLGIPEEKVFIIPNGVDVKLFFPNNDSGLAIRSHYGLDSKLVVGFVGGFRPYHGLNVLIDSARLIVNEYPQVHFLIVGDGPLREALELQVREQGLTDVITFTGSVPFRDVPAYINAMDVTVAPFSKLREFEYWSVKIFEYMAVAKPIVASGYPSSESPILDRRNGLLVEPGDKYQLAQAILKLLVNRDLRERLGAEGRRMVEGNYTWERNARTILQIYESLPKRGDK